MATISPPIEASDVIQGRRVKPASAFDALVNSLARSDDVDAELADSICRAADKTLADLADAVRARVAEQVRA